MPLVFEIALVALGGAIAFVLGIRLIWATASTAVTTADEPAEKHLALPPVPEVPAAIVSERPGPRAEAHSTRAAEFLLH